MIEFEFEQREIPGRKTGGARAVPSEVLEQFRKVVEALEKGREGVVRLQEKTELSLARRAIREAGVQTKNWVRVRKERGSDGVLLVHRITKREYDEVQKKAAARGEKLGGNRKPKVKAKAKSR